MDCQDYTDFMETTLWPLLQEYKPNNIYIADGTSLFYKALANGTYAFSAEAVRGSKYLNSKDRLSLMLCTNMTDTDKLQLLIIGKAAWPHALKRKGFDLIDLKVDYYHNINGWMTAAVYEHWLSKWNKRLARQKCHIFLLVDNAPSHITKEYSNIRVQYLPPNTTSKLQPLDQGIIHVCKLKYCSLMTDKLWQRHQKVIFGFDFVTYCK